MMIEAKFYNKALPVRSWRYVTVHCTQSPERKFGARSVARWFASPWDPKKKVWVKASAHVVVDDTEVVQCVPFDRIAYHARGINSRSLGIEFVGYKAQSEAEWLDEFGKRMLVLGGKLLGTLASQYGVQLDDFILAGGLLKGSGGVTTHWEVTKAYRVPGGHTDPGAAFPMAVLLDLSRRSKPKSA